jgi:hypothetical protein
MMKNLKILKDLKFFKELNFYKVVSSFLLALTVYAYNDIKENITRYSISQNLLMEKAVENIGVLNSRLENIRSKVVTKPKYVSVSLFHNGKITVNRFHILKVKRIAEAKEYGTPDKKDLNSDKDLLPYVPLVSQLRVDGKIYIKDAQRLENETLKVELRRQKVKSVIYFPVYYKNFQGVTDICGFVCLEFSKPTNFSDRYVDFIKNECQIVDLFIQRSIENKISSMQ